MQNSAVACLSILGLAFELDLGISGWRSQAEGQAPLVRVLALMSSNSLWAVILASIPHSTVR